MNVILFEDFDSDVKPVMGSSFGNFRIESLASVLVNSKPAIELMTGKDLLDSLIEAYEDSPSDEEMDLIKVIRKPLINMAFFQHSNTGSLAISDSGYVNIEGENGKKPFAWQIRLFQKQCLSDYAAGMNELWIYLNENADDFSDWLETDEYANLKQRPINRLNQWEKAGRRISNWRTHYALFPEMNLVWDDMKDVLSTALWEDLNTELLDDLSEENEDLMKYIRRYVAHATIARAAHTLPIVIDADGILLNEVAATSNNNDVIKQESDRAGVERHAKEEACKAMSRLKTFLNNNATEDTYSGYFSVFLENPAEPTRLNDDGDKLIFM
jgi:hypothetical protein